MDFPFAAIGALLAGIGGLITAWTAIRKAKTEGSTTCHEQLAATRTEAETYARQLHRIRIQHPELIDNDDGAAALWMLAAVGLFALAVILAMVALGLTSPEHGPPGPPGPIGPTGPSGPTVTATTVVVVPGTGTNTETGITGEPGQPGLSGTAGSTGSTGLAGAPGSPGESVTGPPGPPGPPGATGSPGPQGERGAPGPVQTAPVCPSGFTLTTLDLKLKGNQTVTAALCVAP